MQTQGDTISILLADAKALFRDALRAILECEQQLRVVADVGEGSAAISAAERTRPDVILLDARIERCSATQAVSAIRNRVPDCRIVVLSDDEDLDTLVAALDAGSSGFVPRTAPFVELIDAVRWVARGEVVVPRSMLSALLEFLLTRKRQQSDLAQRIARLTPRQREVLRLLSDGADNDVIARRLLISPETARTHVQNLMTKLGVHSRLEAAALLARTGLADELTIGNQPPDTTSVVGAVS